MDHSAEALIGLVVARGNAPERFETAEEVFDEMAPAVHVEVAGDGLRPMGLGRDDCRRAPLVQFGAQPINIEGLVGQQRGEIEVLDQRRDTDAIVSLARQEDEAHQIAERIDQRHDLGR